MKDLTKRILDISRKYGLSHIGSSISALPVIFDIYSKKKPDEKFICSCGHSGLALYVVMEYFNLGNAEDLFNRCGSSPKRSKDIYCSTGSLGMGITVAVGMALADKNKTVYCLISDGEAYEGSVFESLVFAHRTGLDNLKIYVNYNGYTAYDETDMNFISRMKAIYPLINIRKTCSDFEDITGLAAHYHILENHA